MSNFERLERAGVVSKDITSEERKVIDSMATDEVDALLDAKQRRNRWIALAADRISLCF